MGVNNSFHSTAIFWDLENVNISKKDISKFLEGLSDFLEKRECFLSYACAYFDWSKRDSSFTEEMIKYNFRLIHIPKLSSGKNNLDMQLSTDVNELMYHFENISRYILITGDSDFKPLVQSLMKSGKIIYVICNLDIASTSFLDRVNDYIDYRSLINYNMPDDYNMVESGHNSLFSPVDPIQQSKQQLSEILKSIDGLRSAALKIKLKLFYPDFNEHNLGFKTWGEFLDSNNDIIEVYYDHENHKCIRLKAGASDNQSVDILEITRSILSKYSAEINISLLNMELNKLGYNVHDFGFNRFKDLINLLIARDIAEITRKPDDITFYIKLK